MRGEAPSFKRCCFCIPLRRGLIGWGYAKLIINILTVAYIILISSLVPRQYIRVKDVVVLSAICLYLLTDAVFNILFVVGGHRKNVKLLRITYIYNVVSLVLVVLAHSFKIYLNLRYLYLIWSHIGFYLYNVIDLIISSGLAFGIIFVQIYFVLLIRSEMIKLRHQTLEIQFSNHLASGEPQCTLHNFASVTDQCTLHNFASVTDQCTGKDAQTVQDCMGKDAHVVQDCTGKDAQAVQNCKGGQMGVTNVVTN